MNKITIALLLMINAAMLGMEQPSQSKKCAYYLFPILDIDTLPSANSSRRSPSPAKPSAVVEDSAAKPMEQPAAALPWPWWSNGGEPSEEMVAKYQQQKPQSYAPEGGKKYRLFCTFKETESYDDVLKSLLVNQVLFKHLCVHAWDRINPIMDRKGSNAFDDLMVKLKRREIDHSQSSVAMTKKDLYHRLLTHVITVAFTAESMAKIYV